MKEFIDKLREILPEEQIRTMEPMAAHTTFRVGGPADYFTEPGDEETLARVQALCRREGMASYILGNGSNLLVADQGAEVFVVKTFDGLNRLETDGAGGVTAGSGALWTAAGSVPEPGPCCRRFPGRRGRPALQGWNLPQGFLVP